METNNNKGKRPLYLNWKLWVAVSTGLILTTIGLVLAFGPAAIVASIAAIFGFVSLLSKPAMEFISSVREGMKENRERSIATERQSKLESDKTNEELNLLRVQYIAISRSYSDLSRSQHDFADDMQEKLAENKGEITELKAQNREQQQEINRLKETHQSEITELKEQIQRMGVDSAGDKAEITALRARVTELETRVAVLDAENAQLKDENRELRGNQRRMITDQLTGLSAEASEKLNHLEKQRQEAKGEIT